METCDYHNYQPYMTAEEFFAEEDQGTSYWEYLDQEPWEDSDCGYDDWFDDDGGCENECIYDPEIEFECDAESLYWNEDCDLINASRVAWLDVGFGGKNTNWDPFCREKETALLVGAEIEVAKATESADSVTAKTVEVTREVMRTVATIASALAMATVETMARMKKLILLGIVIARGGSGYTLLNSP